MEKNFTKLIYTLTLIFLNTSLYSQTVFRGVVLDAKSKSPIVEAKIGISSQGVGEVTGSTGYFSYTKHHKILEGNSILEISAPGYKKIIKKGKEIRKLFGVVSTIYLERDQKYKQKHLQTFDDVTIYWDASAVANKRDFNTIWERVSHFINTKQVKELRVIVFNTTIVWEEKLQVNRGALDVLQKKLSNLNYTGLSNYDMINSPDTDTIL